MKRVFLGLLAVLLLAGLALFLNQRQQQPDEAVQRTRPSKDQQPAARVAVRPNRCRVVALVSNGQASQASLHDPATVQDFPARIEAAGRRFTADVEGRGQLLEVVVRSDDGRSAHASARCPLSGYLHLSVHFPDQHEDAHSLTGRCTYLDTGAPVADARVQAVELRTDRTMVAVTDDEGSFQLALPEGRYELVCRSHHDHSAPRRLTMTRTKSPPVELYVEPGAALAGSVSDTSGQPIAGARVTARNVAGLQEQSVERRSDAEGKFLLEGLRPGAVIVSAAKASAFAETQAVARVELPYARADLVLSPAGAFLSGSVSDLAGTLLEGAVVEVIPRARSRGANPSRRRSSTESDGTFVVAGLAPGPHRVRVSKSGFGSEDADLNLRRGENRVAYRLTAGCVAEVTIAATEPPESFELEVDEGRRGQRRTFRGQTGETLQIPATRKAVAVRLRGLDRASEEVAQQIALCPGPVALALGKTVEGGVLVVSVKDKGGAPVEGVLVRRPKSGRTNAEGEARLVDLEPGEHWVQVDGADWRKVTIKAGEDARVEFVIEAEQGGIAGQVVAEDGPVEGAAVVADCAEGFSVRARSAADGRFSFTPEGPGSCRVRAEHPERGQSRTVVLQAGDDQAELRLEALASIAGAVRDAKTGAPVPSYQLSVMTLAADGRSARTVMISEPSGRYRVDRLPAGRVSVEVSGASGKARRELTLAAGAQETGVDLELRTNGQLTGTFVSAKDETPVAGVVVEIKAGRRTLGRVASDGAGRIKFLLPAGQAPRAFASKDGYYPWASPTLELDGAGVSDLGTIRLEGRGGDDEKEGGIGIAFRGEPDGIRIIGFTDDSPSRDAGMRMGDLIVSIDGSPFGREPLINWVVRLRGAPDTPVVLGFERGTQPPMALTVIRRSIGLDRVPSSAGN